LSFELLHAFEKACDRKIGYTLTLTRQSSNMIEEIYTRKQFGSISASSTHAKCGLRSPENQSGNKTGGHPSKGLRRTTGRAVQGYLIP